jgi:DNA-binding CsgD family transcriptional regulator
VRSARITVARGGQDSLRVAPAPCRRGGRRVEAREQLRAAHGAFTAMGMDAFAERTRRELAATGETVRKRMVDTRQDLTAQESHIARLATQGLTNPEIGAELFVSPRIVEWHLRKVFAKLGITARKHLREALEATTPSEPAIASLRRSACRERRRRA